MDIKIENGDFAVTNFGRPAVIFGDDELMQRIENRLKLPKGSVFLKGDMGSELHLLENCSESEENHFAEKCVRNALKDMKEIAVENVSVKKQNGGIDITVSVRVLSNNLIYEVNI